MIKTIAILVVMLVVNFLMVVSISRAAKRVDYSLRKLFIQRLSHDDMGMSMPDVKAMQQIKAEEPPDEAGSEGKKRRKHKEQVLLAANETAGRAGYKSKTIKDDYKAIRQISGFTPETALSYAKRQVEKSRMDEGIRDYKGLFSLLDYDTVYSMNALDPDRQEALLRSTLKPEHIGILDAYLEETGAQLDCIEFYGYLNQMAAIYNSGFHVVTGNKKDEGNTLKDGTTLSFDDQICEGAQVIYKNRMFDFSI